MPTKVHNVGDSPPCIIFQSCHAPPNVNESRSFRFRSSLSRWKCGLADACNQRSAGSTWNMDCACGWVATAQSTEIQLLAKADLTSLQPGRRTASFTPLLRNRVSWLISALRRGTHSYVPIVSSIYRNGGNRYASSLDGCSSSI